MARARVTVHVRWTGLDVSAIARTLASSHLTNGEKCERMSELLLSAQLETVDERVEFEREVQAQRESMALLTRVRSRPGPSAATSPAGRNEPEIGLGSGSGNS